MARDKAMGGAAVTQAILRRYPCGDLPYGTAAELAREFGLSRQRLSQITATLGYGLLPKAKPVVLCGSCGDVTAMANGICRACRWVSLPCAFCGTPKKVRAAPLATQISWSEKRAAEGLPAYQGNVYCDRKCFGKAMGRTAGFGGHPENRRYNGKAVPA